MAQIAVPAPNQYLKFLGLFRLEGLRLRSLWTDHDAVGRLAIQDYAIDRACGLRRHVRGD